MSFCPKCGNKIKDGQTFCSKCGHKLNVINNSTELNNNADSFANPNEESAEPIKITNLGEIQEGKPSEIIENEIEPSAQKNPSIQKAAQPSEKTNIVEGVIVAGKSKKTKVIAIAICAAFVVLAVLFYTGYLMTRPSKVVSEFEKDVASGNKARLCKVLYCSDSRINIDQKSIDPLMTYFKANPNYLNKVVQDLSNQETGLSVSKSVFTLEKLGNKYLFFSNYKVVIKPAFIDVNTEIKDADLLLNNDKVGKSDSDNFKKEFGPFIPGEYTLEAKYQGKYVNINEKHNIDLVTSTDNKMNVKVLEKLAYLKIDSDYKDAELFVDGKDTGIKISDEENFGPLKDNSEVYAVATKDGQKLKSDVYTVGSDGGDDVYLDFSRSENNLENVEDQLKNVMRTYIDSFTEAVNYGNFSIVQSYIYPGSKLYSDQSSYIPNTYKSGTTEINLSFNITSYTLSDDKKSGTISTNEVYEIRDKDNNSSVKTFNYKYTFQYNDKTESYQLSSIAAN